MALDVYKLYIPDDVPPGHFAGKLIKAIYTDTKESVFPCDGAYGKDWKHAISYLSRKRRKAFDEPDPQGEKTSHVATIYPIENLTSVHTDKPFMHWRVPSRYSDRGRPTSREEKLAEVIRNDKTRAQSSRQVEKSHTTHHVPPYGKFQPIKSEQQERMEQVLKREEEIQKIINAKPTTLPRLSVSPPNQEQKLRPLEPKTFSAAQRWLKKHPGKEKLAERVLQQFRTSEVDKALEKTVEPNAQKAVKEWLKNATETDRKAAINFFSTVGGSRFVGGVSGSHPSSNTNGNKDARLQAILSTLEKNRGEAPSQAFQRHQTIDDNIKALMKAARRRHLRLLTPETRLRHKEFQTWHHMPIYPYKGRVANPSTMYSIPNAPTPRDFRIHPEWEL